MKDNLDRDPTIAALLDVERAADAPVASLDRVWSRLTASVAASPAPPRGDARPGRLAGRIAARPMTAVAIAFVVGIGVGAGMSGAVGTRFESAKPRKSQEPTPAAPTAPSFAVVATPPIAPEVASGPPVAPAAVVAARPVPPRHPSTPASSLSEERALLDSARSALGEGEGARALAITDAHVRRFVHPQLGEEREALAIQALVIAGRFVEARARADRFRANSPDSLFLPAVLASLASIP